MNPKLKVTDVERIVLDVPFTPRCEPWNALLVDQWRVIEVIRVTTDAGFIGYGEALPHYTLELVSDDAIERVMGGNPAEFLGDDSLGIGLQMALYDVVGQALGVPLHRLLNLPQVREWCPLAWWNTKMPPEVLAEEARDALAAGYTTHKFKARPWIDVFEQVEAISAVTPATYRLDMDWNEMLLNAGNAVPVLTELDHYERVAIYETPIFRRDIEGYRLLRRMVKHPLADHLRDASFTDVIYGEAYDGFLVTGGISDAIRQGLIAGEFTKPFWLQMVGTGLMTALTLHLGAVLPLAQWPAVTCLNNYVDDLLVAPLTIQGGYMRVPDAPGLGVEVDEDALARYRMEPPYQVALPRQLISIVWADGQVMHYASMPQCWEDFRSGNQPIQERGVKMEVHPDDGSPEWAELYARAQRGPVRDHR